MYQALVTLDKYSKISEIRVLSNNYYPSMESLDVDALLDKIRGLVPKITVLADLGIEYSIDNITVHISYAEPEKVGLSY